jgi:hypothetical protein
MLVTAWFEAALTSLGLAGGILLIARGLESLFWIMNPANNPAGPFTWLPPLG